MEQPPELLPEREHRTTEEVRRLIQNELEVELYLETGSNYPEKDRNALCETISTRLLSPRKCGGSPKKIPPNTDDTVIGFLEETSPRTPANSPKLWFFEKLRNTKNTTKLLANTFGV